LNRVVKETESVVEMWSRLVSTNTENECVETPRGRDVNSYRFGERLEEPVGHPTILLSINAMKATDSLASSDPELATAWSIFIDAPVNRFLHASWPRRPR
jgi:4-hydroxybutyryl-CoA dehydratase / vinylacetyl-CoA-Delta-isomerase